MRKILLSFLCVFSLTVLSFGQEGHEGHNHDNNDQADHAEDHGNSHAHGNECGHVEEDVPLPGPGGQHVHAHAEVDGDLVGGQGREQLPDVGDRQLEAWKKKGNEIMGQNQVHFFHFA